MTCWKHPTKSRWDDQQTAETVAVVRSAAVKNPLRAYYCAPQWGGCSGWHLTSKPLRDKAGETDG